MSKPDIDQNLIQQWLQGTSLKGETEGFVITAQDQSLPTTQQKSLKTDPTLRAEFSKIRKTIDRAVSWLPTPL